MFQVPSSKFQERGFTLLEVIIAISITIIGIVGVYLAFFRIIFVFPIVSSRLTAAYLAQEGIEIVRNLRDANWLKQETDPTTPWNNGLIQCSMGCEADYKTGTPEQETSLRFYNGGSYLNIDNIDNNNLYSYSAGTPTEYKRKITIDQVENDILRVIVQVYWEVKGKPYNFEVEEYLYNWK